VRGFKFSGDNGKLTSIIIAAIGLPLIPDNVLSTYEFSIDEVVSSGPNRLIVFEGSEERLEQLSVGFLERIGLGKAPWEDEYSYKPPVIRPENQLAAGTPISAPAPVIRAQPPVQQTVWEDDNWQEVQAAPLPQKLQAEARYYDDDDEGENWNEPKREPQSVPTYKDVSFTPVAPAKSMAEDIEELADEDLWGEKSEPEDSQRPIVNIEAKVKLDLTQKVQQVEYQEEEQY
jgi:hypothetical protein